MRAQLTDRLEAGPTHKTFRNVPKMTDKVKWPNAVNEQPTAVGLAHEDLPIRGAQPGQDVPLLECHWRITLVAPCDNGGDGGGDGGGGDGGGDGGGGDGGGGDGGGGGSSLITPSWLEKLGVQIVGGFEMAK